MTRHWLPLPACLRVSLFGLWLCAGAVLASPVLYCGHARADDAEARYQTTIEEAVREFGLGNWAEARALFRRAHGLSPNARTWRGMGMAAFELKQYVDALRELSASLQDQNRALTAEQRTQTQKLIDQSRAYVGRYQVVLEPAQAKPWVDGQEALFEPGNFLLLGLGDHVASATADGYQEVRVPLRVAGSEDMVLRISLQPLSAPAAATPALAPVPAAAPAAAAPPTAATTTAPAESSGNGLRTAAWVTLGATVLLAGGSAAFWLVGEGKYKDLKMQCGTHCADAQIADSGVKRADTLTTVFLALTATAAVTSGILFVVSAGHGSGSEHASAVEHDRMALRVGPGFAQLQGSF